MNVLVTFNQYSFLLYITVLKLLLSLVKTKYSTKHSYMYKLTLYRTYSQTQLKKCARFYFGNDMFANCEQK